MDCSICGRKIVLVPSARERANKAGGTPQDYTRLFTEHAECAIKRRNKETLALMRKG